MNILVVTQIYPEPDDIGFNKPTKTVEYFAKEWVDMGHKVIVIHCPSKFPLFFYLIPKFIKEKFAAKRSTIFPSIESRKEIERIDNNIVVHRIPIRKTFPGKAFSSRRLKRVEKQILSYLEDKTFTPSIILGHFANPSLEIVAMLTRDCRCKSAIVFHRDCNEDTILRYRILQNIGSVNNIGARSKVEATRIKDLLKLETMPFVCYSGVPNYLVSEISDECNKHDYSEDVSLLCVGSLLKRKHIDSVINAFAKLYKKQNKTALTIIGKGEEEDYLKSLTRTKDCFEAISFMTECDRTEVIARMKKAHIFALISSNEAFGMVYLEAMSQGCIVIAAKGEGFDGIISDGENGFLCEAGNENMLYEIFFRIFEMSEEDRNRIGLAAMKTAARYSEREVAQRYLEDAIK